MAKKRSFGVWQTCAFILLALLIPTSLLLYRQFHYEDLATNIQVGNSYADTTYGYEFTFPANNQWNVVRNDEVAVNIGRGGDWEYSFLIFSVLEDDDRFTKDEIPYDIEINQKLINSYSTNESIDKQFAPLRECDSSDQLGRDYCAELKKKTTFMKLNAALPSYFFETKNIHLGEVCSGQCYIQDLYVKVDHTFVVMHRDGAMSKINNVDLVSLANNIKAIPITTGTIRGNRTTPGKITLYHSDKHTPAAYIYIHEGDSGFRLMMKPGTYYVKNNNTWQKVIVKLGGTTRLEVE